MHKQNWPHIPKTPHFRQAAIGSKATEEWDTSFPLVILLMEQETIMVSIGFHFVLL